MINKIFSIYDSKAEIYGFPFQMLNTPMAIRSVTDAVNNPSHDLGKHPEDYTLFEVGDWDDVSGNITMYPTKKAIHNCLELRTQKTMFDGEDKTSIFDKDEVTDKEAREISSLLKEQAE